MGQGGEYFGGSRAFLGGEENLENGEHYWVLSTDFMVPGGLSGTQETLIHKDH
jgi:hypothetical protein